MPIVLWSVQEWEKKAPDNVHEEIKNTLEKIYSAKTIYERFDRLAELIDQCKSAAQSSNDKILYNTLEEQATQFATAIVDAKNPLDLIKKITDRNEFKKIDPEYMPWSVPHTRADISEISSKKAYPKSVLQHAVKNAGVENFNQVNAEDQLRDKLNQVNYLTTEQREEFRILIADGKFKKIQLSADEENLVLDNFDTKMYAAHETLDEAIFVQAPKGDLFAGSTDPEVFHHSSFLGGNATTFAGTVTVTNGNLQKLTDNSGHYMPPAPVTIKMLAFLRQTGVLDNKLASEMWNDNFLRFDELSNSPFFSDHLQ